MFNKLNCKNTIFLFLLSISCLFSVSTQAKTPEEEAQEVIDSSEELKKFMSYYEVNKLNIKPKVLVSGLTVIVNNRSKSVLDRHYIGGSLLFKSSEIKLPTSSYGMELGSYTKFKYFIILNKNGNLNFIHFEPREQFEISRLEMFDELIGVSISKFDISSIDLSSLNKIKELSIFDIKSEEIYLPSKNEIESLSISFSPVIKVSELDSLKNLEYLKIRDSNIKSLSSLDSSSKLRYLMFKNNNNRVLTELPDFSYMPKLEFLHFFAEETSNIKGIDELSNLKVLFSSQGLDYSKIKFPESLEYLSVGGDINYSFPDLSGNKNLKELTITATNSEVISGLDNLINLKRISLSYNKINKISGLENLTNLEEISLYGNEITKVEGLDNLENIKFIKLDKNKITKVEGLKNLSGVKGISFENNPIETLDFSEIEHLKNTKVLMWYTPFWKTATKEDKRKLDNLARKGHL